MKRQAPLPPRHVLKKGHIYLFEWNDTYSYTKWVDEEDIDELTQKVVQSSTGIFVKETKDWYIIAMHKNPHDNFRPWGTPCWIPKQCVKKVRRLYFH